MFIDVIKNRLEQGNKTSKYPKSKISLPKNYRGLPIINSECSKDIVENCAKICPQDAINVENKSIDLRRCTFCGECEKLSNGEFVKFSQNFEMGTTNENDLIIGRDNKNMELKSKEYFKKIFGGSLQLRVISAGGCNSCEADINVLNTPVFDLSRFGIQFAASPRHADGLLIVGPITKNMEYALKMAYEAIPNPKVVIASGACALSGGVFRDNSEQLNGVSDLFKVDLFVPGCPPHPMTLLYALVKFFSKKK
ncbi:MAG: hydrogenase [Fusobacteriia bacterium 4572_132]|nr:MAG: hydrogenase [Fusobacteriia bacterium 4572_132]